MLDTVNGLVAFRARVDNLKRIAAELGIAYIYELDRGAICGGSWIKDKTGHPTCPQCGDRPYSPEQALAFKIKGSRVLAAESKQEIEQCQTQ